MPSPVHRQSHFLGNPGNLGRLLLFGLSTTQIGDWCSTGSKLWARPAGIPPLTDLDDVVWINVT